MVFVDKGGINMNKDEQLEQVIKALYDGLDSAALLSVNEDGSLNVVKEEKSNYSFIVYDKERVFEPLLSEFKKLGYFIDLDTVRGLIPGFELIKVDVVNKTITRPLVVSINHHKYLIEKESILLLDAANNFDELVVKENKDLAESLCQYNKNKDHKNEII